MNSADLLALLPFIALTASAVIVMLTISFYRSHGLTAALTETGLLLSFASLFSVAPLAPRTITPLLILDHYALFFSGLIFAASMVVVALSYVYLKKREGNHEEFYLLLLLAVLGSAMLVGSSHFASLFLGLEILSVSLYALLAYLRDNERCIEAGFKYLVLASVASAFMLFGMALVYAVLGTMNLADLSVRAADARGPLLLTGMAMIVIGVGFKLAVVPFHMWTPDVYEGAPAPVTAFVATVSKGAVFALLLRYFTRVDIHSYDSLFRLFTAIAIASMFGGNLLALFQNNVKRLLAYSSIAHLGYLLVAFLAGGSIAVTAAAYYLVAYFVTTLGAFGVITVLSAKEREADRIDDYRGLAFSHPWPAAVFTVMLLSLAGIPLTAGFVAKFSVAAAGVGSALWALVLILVINSGVGLFYYLRILITMYTGAPEKGAGKARIPKVPLAGSLVLAALTLLLVWMGVHPSPLIELIQKTVLRML